MYRSLVNLLESMPAFNKECNYIFISFDVVLYTIWQKDITKMLCSHAMTLECKTLWPYHYKVCNYPRNFPYVFLSVAPIKACEEEKNKRKNKCGALFVMSPPLHYT
uniref:Uncharacterized protein n=1 Tax=Glossina austeni TaxID=7395 RepID=A0A1A9VDX0_GLOAU